MNITVQYALRQIPLLLLQKRDTKKKKKKRKEIPSPQGIKSKMLSRLGIKLKPSISGCGLLTSLLEGYVQ